MSQVWSHSLNVGDISPCVRRVTEKYSVSEQKPVANLAYMAFRTNSKKIQITQACSMHKKEHHFVIFSVVFKQCITFFLFTQARVKVKCRKKLYYQYSKLYNTDIVSSLVYGNTCGRG